MYDLQRCYKLLEKISFNRVAGSIEETKAREKQAKSDCRRWKYIR